MPSLKMKSKVGTHCLTERKDLDVCPQSKVISKKPCSKIILSAQVAGIDNTIQNCIDVSSRIPEAPKDIASVKFIDKEEFLNKENSKSQQQHQAFFLDSSALESANPCTENMETIYSPNEPIEVNSQCSSQEDAGSAGDTDMPGLTTDESDEGRSTCGYETCDVSDFNISDMIITSLPLGGYSFHDDIYDDIFEVNYLSDYRTSEPAIFDVSDENMIQPAFEDTSDIISSRESMMVGENDSFYSALCQKRSCNEDSDVKNDSDKTECFDPQLFIKNLPELSDIESNDLPTQTPKQSQRRKSVTLVLDLDETLVHSTMEHCDDADFTFPVLLDMKEYTVYVKQRPNLLTFLEKVSEMFEVVIFTASQSIYAKQLLDILDPDGRLISRRVYRESCIFSDGNYIKDLTVLGVDLAKVVIIDNSPQVFRLQVNNGIPIKSWFDDQLDCALISLIPLLETLADADDVRPIIAQRFANDEYL